MSEDAIETKHKEAYKLLLEIRDELEQIETGQDTSVFIEGRISANLNNLARLTEHLEGLVLKQSPAKRELWRIKVKQLSEECKSLRTSLANFMNEKYKQKKLEEERAQLFERKSKHQQDNDGLRMQVRESESLDRASRNARDIEDAGYSILSGIGQQNEKLKDIQKRLYDIGMTLGLSKSIMRVIERRQTQEKIILFGGMATTLLIIFLLWYYVR
mmetsp:Transcript_9035/g.12420  ORF Transcript_9035/g.12420 Transcript_9035/m.12420 type:complete len:215 (-) Transcript_9035:30-674(-)